MAALTVVRGTNGKPAASEALISALAACELEDAQVFLGFPLILTAAGHVAIDAMLISEKHGLIVFDVVEGVDADDYRSRQDDLANGLAARLATNRALMDGRESRVEIGSVTFAPSVEPDPLAEYPLADTQTLAVTLQHLGAPISSAICSIATSQIESLSTVRAPRTRRKVTDRGSRGARLQRLEESIATLDHLQSRAVIETVEGVQRIRGLAGSGKTIVLALKAAYLHARHPHWRLAVTFNTRSLKPHFRRLITRFCIEQTGTEPDWDLVRIVNAWGAPGGVSRDGLYYEFCRTNNLEYLDFRAARAKGVVASGDAFAFACETALEQAQKPSPAYDAILIDEAQDLPPAFLRLAYSLLHAPKRLVYAYDELQNLGGEAVLPPEELFGIGTSGRPAVTLGNTPDSPRRDIILERCYRNSRPVLTAAHALGFGVYREPEDQDPAHPGLVQMFDRPELWTDIGYRVAAGRLEAGASVELERTAETSPPFLEEHSPIPDLVQFHRFGTPEEQSFWLADAIESNLRDDDLRFDDIVVISGDPRTTAKDVGPARALLLDKGIGSHVAGVDTDPDVFFSEETRSVTFTGIYRAKGNEAGMIYVLNAHDFGGGGFNLATRRNRLFTAMTRSKAWVRVLGVGPAMAEITREFERLVERDYRLSFRYPTEAERQHLRIVHRDMSREERRRLESRQRSLDDVLSSIEEGAIRLEDLDPRITQRLRELFGNGSGAGERTDGRDRDR